MENKVSVLHLRCEPEFHTKVSRNARKLGLTITQYVKLCIEHGHERVVKSIQESEK